MKGENAMSEALLLVAEGYEQIAAGIRKMVAAQKDLINAKKQYDQAAQDQKQALLLTKNIISRTKAPSIRDLSDRWLASKKERLVKLLGCLIYPRQERMPYMFLIKH